MPYALSSIYAGYATRAAAQRLLQLSLALASSVYEALSSARLAGVRRGQLDGRGSADKINEGASSTQAGLKRAMASPG